MANLVFSPPVAVILLACVVAGVIDVWKFKIHNILTLPLILAGLIYHVVHGAVANGWAGTGSGLSDALLGTMFGFGILFPFYLLGGMGAGDVKLMAAVGAWLGWESGETLLVFLATSFAAGAYSVVLLLLFGGWRETMVNLWRFGRRPRVNDGPGGEDVAAMVNKPQRRKRLIPFGLMMAVGVIALLAANWLE